MPKTGKKSWRETISVKVRSEILFPGQNFLFLTHLVRCAVVALCRVQSAIPALWLQSATPAFRIRFGTFRQWCVEFLPRTFTHFGRPTVENYESVLGLVILRCDHESNFRNFDLERLRTCTPMVRKFPYRIFYPFFASHDRKLRIGFLSGVRPNGTFNRRAIKIYVQSF